MWSNVVTYRSEILAARYWRGGVREEGLRREEGVFSKRERDFDREEFGERERGWESRLATRAARPMRCGPVTRPDARTSHAPPTSGRLHAPPSPRPRKLCSLSLASLSPVTRPAICSSWILALKVALSLSLAVCFCWMLNLSFFLSVLLACKEIAHPSSPPPPLPPTPSLSRFLFLFLSLGLFLPGSQMRKQAQEASCAANTHDL